MVARVSEQELLNELLARKLARETFFINIWKFRWLSIYYFDLIFLKASKNFPRVEELLFENFFVYIYIQIKLSV